MRDIMGLRIWKRAALTILATGIALAGYMVTVEGEPGAVPVGLILTGAVAYGVMVLKSRGPDT